MGVYKRGNYWYARIFWRDNARKRHTKTKGHFKTKKEASDYFNAEKTRLNVGLQIDVNPIFAEYFWQWYLTYKEPHIRHQTKKRYKTNYQIAKTYWHVVKIKDINRTTWQQFINEVGQTRSTNTVQLLNRQFRACVKNAIADGIIERDFTFGVQISGNDENTRKTKVNLPSAKQITTLLNYCMDHANTKAISYYVITTSILSGARIGEVLGLRWQDIHPRSKTIDIHHSYDNDTHSLGATKNTSSYRTIRMNSAFFDLIKPLKGNKDDYVFKNDNDLPVTPHSVNTTLHTALRNCKIPDENFTIHTLRHCHVALLRHYETDWYEISQRLGHENLSTTLKTYAYMIKEEKRKHDTHVEGILDQISK